MRKLILAMAMALAASPVAADSENKNVIFFHPDGYGFSHWNALRYWHVGPQGRLNWDRLPHLAPYIDHMNFVLGASSHGGATIHAYGVKVEFDSFGMDGGRELTALSGRRMSIMQEAVAAGFATALVNSGSIHEPGTAAFVASAPRRGRGSLAIDRQVIESGVDVILSGGEQRLLPVGVMGRHGQAGTRTDGLNLIERARALGYTIVYNRDELLAEARSGRATRVLGVFAPLDTFNTGSEEALRAARLPLYFPGAPTIAEMSAAALTILQRNPRYQRRGFFAVVEEEGTDNFGNVTNASGSFEAGRRADEAFGVFADFVAENQNTLLITAADSSAGNKTVLGLDTAGMPVDPTGRVVLPPIPPAIFMQRFNTDSAGLPSLALIDGVDGPFTAPFFSAPDRTGRRLPFGIAWATAGDNAGAVLARAKGYNAELVSELGVVDNTDIYRIMYYTLFDRWLTGVGTHRPLPRQRDK